MAGPGLLARSLLPLLLVSAVVQQARAASEPSHGAVTGRVVSSSRPLAEATVFVYRTVERSLRRAVTADDGAFGFTELPLGLYKLVAYKPGFLPEVALLLIEKASAQTIQIELQPQAGRDRDSDYWKIRSEIPADVLREISGLPVLVVTQPLDAAAVAPILTEMVALTGVESSGSLPAAQVAAGTVGVDGRVGPVRVSVQGDYRKRAPDSALSWSGGVAAGSATRLAVQVETPNDSSFVLDSSSRSWEFGQGVHAAIESDLSQLELRYRTQIGSIFRADVRAGYEAYRGWIVPGLPALVHGPDGARSVWLEGRLSSPLTESSRLVAGLRVRETTPELGSSVARGLEVARRHLEAFGLAEWQPNAIWLVRYGLYSRHSDGTLAVAPQGSLVVRLGTDWQAGLEGAWRWSQAEGFEPDFRTASVSAFDSIPCDPASGTCARLHLEHGSRDARQFTVSLSWTEFAGWARLLLNDSLVPQGEGLLLFPGDVLPGVAIQARQRLGSSWTSRWSARYASGGGEEHLSGRQAWSNQLDWWAAALEMSYLPWSSGIYLSFQRLDQEVVVANRSSSHRLAQFERAELVLTQDLGGLFDLAREWSVRLGFELYRGATLLEPAPRDAEALRHRLTTGFAVRF